MAYLIHNGKLVTSGGNYITSDGLKYIIDYGLFGSFGTLNYIRLKVNGDIVDTITTPGEFNQIEVDPNSNIQIEYSISFGSFAYWDVNGDTETYGAGTLTINNVSENYVIRLHANWK